MKFSCNNKWVLVTGASSGIGRALSYALAEKGAQLLLIGRNTAELEHSLAECYKRSKRSHKEVQHYIYTVDLSKEEHIHPFMQFLEQKNIHTDVLLLSAGTSMHAKVIESTVQLYRSMYEYNCITSISITQALLPELIERKAMIVSMNSVQSVIGVPFHGAYAAAKHAVSAYLETLELEEPNIDIVELKLGWIRDTNIRKNALAGDGSISHTRKNNKRDHGSSIALDDCIKKIIYAIEHKKRYMYVPQSWKHILFAKYAFRTLLHKKIKQKAYKDSA